MSVERIKAELDEFKVYRNTVMGVIIAILGFIVTTYKTTENFVIIFGIGAVVVLSVVLVGLSFAIREQIRRL